MTTKMQNRTQSVAHDPIPFALQIAAIRAGLGLAIIVSLFAVAVRAHA